MKGSAIEEAILASGQSYIVSLSSKLVPVLLFFFFIIITIIIIGKFFIVGFFFPKQECKGGNYFELLFFTNVMHFLQAALWILNLWVLLSNLLTYQKG